MPSRRVYTEPVAADVPLRPQAGSAGVFGASDAGSELAQIAQAFGALSPSLTRLGQQMAQRSAQSDQIAGEEAARVLEESRLGYHEAIKRGLIEPNDSPWFRYGLKKQGGINAALKYQRELTAAVQELPEEATLADFENFEREWFEKWSGENGVAGQRDAAFVQGFAASAAQARQGVALAFASRQNQASLKLFEEGLSSRLGAVASSLAKDATDAEFADAAEKMNAILAEAQTLNPRIRARLTEMVTGVLYSESLARRDEGMFKKLAAKIKGGTGPFDQITSVKLNLEKLTGEIIQNESRDRQVRDTREKERREVSYRGALVEFSTAARDLKRWDLVDPEPFAQKLEAQGMPEEAADLRRFALSYRENRFAVASQTVYKGLVVRAVDGSLDAKGVFKYVGTITPEQTITLVNLIEGVGSGSGKGPLAEGFRSPIWQAAVSGVKQTIAGLQSTDPTAGLVEIAVMGSLINRYEQFLQEFAEKGAKPTGTDVTRFLNENLEATIEENAGKFRENLIKTFRSFGGLSSKITIREAPNGPIIPPRDVLVSVGSKYFKGLPLTALEQRTLRDAMPDVSLDNTTEAKRRLTELIRSAANADNTNQP